MCDPFYFLLFRSLVFNGTDLGPVLLHQITDLKMFKDISSGNKKSPCYFKLQLGFSKI